jgi:hypothetical protein
VTVTVVLEETGDVFTEKLAEVCPPGTLTTPGAVATELLVASVTLIPPAGAGALKITAPVEAAPPGTLVGLSSTDCNSGGAFGSAPRFIHEDLVTPPAVASMRTAL